MLLTVPSASLVASMPEDKVVLMVDPTVPLAVIAPVKVIVPDVMYSSVFSHVAENGSVADVVVEEVKLIQVSSSFPRWL